MMLNHTQDLEQGWRGIYAPEPEDGERPDSWKDMSIASGGCPVIWRVNAQGAALGPPMMGACLVPPVFECFPYVCPEPVLVK